MYTVVKGLMRCFCNINGRRLQRQHFITVRGEAGTVMLLYSVSVTPQAVFIYYLSDELHERKTGRLMRKRLQITVYNISKNRN